MFYIPQEAIKICKHVLAGEGPSGLKTPETQRDLQSRVLEGEGAYRSGEAITATDYKSPPEAAFPPTSVDNQTLSNAPYWSPQMPHPSGGTCVQYQLPP